VAEVRAEVRVEVAALRAEIGMRAEIDALKNEIASLRAERRGLKVVS